MLESLVRTLASVGALKTNDLLLASVGEGVERRVSKVADLTEKKLGKKAKKRQGDEAVAWEWLIASGERISKVLDRLEESSEADMSKAKK